MESIETVDILLVEDNPADAELTLHALQRSRLAKRIHWVKDGEEALDFLFCQARYSNRRFDAAPRIVLLDLKLPKIGGLQVLASLKNDPRTKAIPVVVMTTSKEERDMISSYKSGVNSYIQKPMSFGDFQEVVRQLGMYWLTVNNAPPLTAFSPAANS